VLIVLALGLFILEAKYTSPRRPGDGGIVACCWRADAGAVALTHAGVSLGVATA